MSYFSQNNAQFARSLAKVSGKRSRGAAAKIAERDAAVRRKVAAEVVGSGLVRGNYAARVYRADRDKENHAKDPTAAPVAIANCFSTSGTVALTPFVPVNGSSAFCLNQVARGDASTERHGKRFSLTALAIRASIFAGSAGTTAIATMVLVWDRAPNNSATLPAFNEIFASQHSEAMTNLNNAPRFKILRRWDIPICGDEDAGAQSENTRVYLNEFIKFKNKVTKLTTADTSGVFPDMVEGALLLYCMGSQAAGTTAPSLSIMTRLYFKDN